MEEILFDMINQAEEDKNYELIGYAKKIVNTLSTTINAPSNWRTFYIELLDKYSPESWVYNEMELWNYENW